MFVLLLMDYHSKSYINNPSFGFDGDKYICITWKCQDTVVYLQEPELKWVHMYGALINTVAYWSIHLPLNFFHILFNWNGLLKLL